MKIIVMFRWMHKWCTIKFDNLWKNHLIQLYAFVTDNIDKELWIGWLVVSADKILNLFNCSIVFHDHI